MIRLPGLRSNMKDYVVDALKASDAAAAAGLHTQGFANSWTDGEFIQLLNKPGVFGYVVRRTGKPDSDPLGFVVARIAADEAEILTIAVAPQARRIGLGRSLMDAVLRRLHSERIASLFLEVSERNAAAIALYQKLGFHQVASRPDYYARKAGGHDAAIVMRCDLA